MTLCAFVKASPINPVITRAIIKPIINPDVSLSSSNTAPIPYPSPPYRCHLFLQPSPLTSDHVTEDVLGWTYSKVHYIALDYYGRATTFKRIRKGFIFHRAIFS